MHVSEVRDTGNGEFGIKRVVLIFLILLIWLMFGCSGSSSDPAPSVQTVKIGVLLPVSGESPIDGLSQKAAVELALEDANEELAASASPTRVTAVIYDTTGSLDEESRLIDALPAANISVAVCSMTSESLRLLNSQITDNGLVVLNDVSTSPHLSVNDHLFRLAPDDRHTASVLADFLWSRGIEKIIVYYRDDWWGSDLKDELTAAYSANGGTVAGAVVYGFRTYAVDMDEKVALLNETVANVLQVTAADKVAVVLLSFEEGIDVLKKAADYPALSTLKWYTGDGLGQNKALLADSDAAAFAAQVGLYAPLIAAVDSPAYSDLKNRIEQKTQTSMYAFSPVIYDAFRLAALARVQGGSAASLKAALLDQAQTYSAVSAADGRIGFNSFGDRSTCAYDIWKVAFASGVNSWQKDTAAYRATPMTLSRLKASVSRVGPGLTDVLASMTMMTGAGRVPSVLLPEPTPDEFLKRIQKEQSEQRR